jgi:hypothetical protein
MPLISFKELVDKDPNLRLLNNQMYLILSSYTSSDVQSKANALRSGYACVFWDGLERYYGSCTLAKQMRLDQQFQNMAMKDRESVTAYFDRLMSLQSEMYAHGMEASDDRLAIKLVNGLSNEYQNIKLLIRSQVGSKTLQELRELILEQEIDLSNARKKTDPLAFQGFRRRRGQGKFQREGGLNSRECWTCGEKGHMQKDCRREPKIANSDGKVKFKPPASFVGIFPRAGDVRFVRDRSQIRFVSDGDTVMVSNGSQVIRNGEKKSCFFVNKPTLNYLDWYLDSGCTDHIARNEDVLTNYRKIESTEIRGLGGMGRAIGIGDVQMRFTNDGGHHEIILRNVLHVPESPVNLISSIQLKRDSKVPLSVIEHDEETVWLVKRGTNQIIGRGMSSDLGLYRMDVKPCVHQIPMVLAAVPMKVWHLRTGHTPIPKIAKMIKDHACEGVQISNDEQCENGEFMSCIKGRMIRSSHESQKSPRKVSPFEIIHSDICGPFGVRSRGGAKYFVTFIDEYSRYCWIYLINKKSELTERFRDFYAFVQNQYHVKIKRLHSDGGGEYIHGGHLAFIRSKGMVPEFSLPDTPQQNGIAERMNRTLLEKVRCMLFESGLPASYWGEALMYANHIVNRLSSNALDSRSPYEKLYDKVPDLSRLRVFGSHCASYQTGKKLGKLESRVESAWFLGIDPYSKGYRVVLDKSWVTVIRDEIKFDEGTMYKDRHRVSLKYMEYLMLENEEEEVVRAEADEVWYDADEEIILPLNTDNSRSESNPMIQEVNHVLRHEPNQDVSHVPHLAQEDLNTSMDATLVDNADVSTEEEDLPDVFLSPSEDSDEESIDIAREYETRSGRISKAPDRLGFHVQKGTTKLEEPIIPKSYAEAMSLPESQYWLAAMEDEYKSLVSNHTWSLVELPKGAKVIDTRWVFTIKRHADGTVDRFKARLVAKGFKQRYGQDYFETFAPVMKISTLRMIVAVSIMFGWHTKQFDVKTAFLNGELYEVIYIRQPDGFVVPGMEHLVCLLGRSLYGLKQSPRQWNHKFNKVLVDAGFTRCRMDPCCYFKRNGSTLVVLLLYVDDGVVMTNSIEEYKVLMKLLQSVFDVKDLGDLQYMLGIQVQRDSTSKKVSMHQGKFLSEVLQRTGMDKCTPVPTPLVPNCELPKYTIPQADVDITAYRSIVGQLNYAMVCTRPDLAFAVGLLARHLQHPGKEHWIALKHVLRYVKGTMQMGVSFGQQSARDPKSDLEFIGYSDASFLGSNDTKATSGYVFLLAAGAVCWSSRKQSITATSTMEAELVALFEATKESIWIRQLISELKFPMKYPMVIYEDNQPGLAFLQDVGVSAKSRHIRLRYYFLRDESTYGYVRFEFCPTTEMVADVLTKSLAREKFDLFRRGLGLTFYGMRGSVGIPTTTELDQVVSLSQDYATPTQWNRELIGTATVIG